MSDDPINPEDKALFRKLMHDVRPLEGNKRVNTVIKPLLRQKKEKSYPQTDFPAPALSTTYYQTVGPETVLSYCHPHFPKKRFLNLQRGTIHCQARLDLHGQTAEIALKKLLVFLEKAGLEGKRSLLIIHGKGQSEAPVIKNLVNHCLPQIPQVLAFHSAHPKDGGTGAVYVVLKFIA